MTCILNTYLLRTRANARREQNSMCQRVKAMGKGNLLKANIHLLYMMTVAESAIHIVTYKALNNILVIRLRGATWQVRLPSAGMIFPWICLSRPKRQEGLTEISKDERCSNLQNAPNKYPISNRTTEEIWRASSFRVWVFESRRMRHF